MECKFADVADSLRNCKRIPIKSSPNRIVVHKCEHGYRYENLDGDTIAIVYHYLGPDEGERTSIRLLVIDGITYTLEVLALPC
jgi:hypothetical protein